MAERNNICERSIDQNNRPLSFGDFKEKYHLTSCPFTIFYGLIAAIPKAWRDNLQVEGSSAVESVLDSINRVPSVSKWVYNNLIKSIFTPPVALNKWKCLFDFTDSHWNNIFQAPFHSVRDSKIQYFQFRFIHRIIGTNYYLYKMGKTDNSRCNFCGRHEETILHLFWECPIVSNFILDIELAIFGNQFVLSKKDMCFG